MNQFAKYSGDEPNKGQGTMSDPAGVLTELHNEFIAVSQALSDLKEELKCIKGTQESQTETVKSTVELSMSGLKEELSALKVRQDEFASKFEELQADVQTLRATPAPTSETPTHMEVVPEPVNESEIVMLPIEETPTETTEVSLETEEQPSDNVLGMSDSEIEALLQEAANSPLPPDEVPPEPEEQEEPGDPPSTDVPEVFRTPETMPELRGLPHPSFDVSVEAIQAVPAALAIGALAVPVSLEDKRLLCKSVEPFDFAALDLIKDQTGFNVVAEEAPIGEVVFALRKYYGRESYDTERDAAAEIAAAPKRKMPWNRSAA